MKRKLSFKTILLILTYVGCCLLLFPIFDGALCFGLFVGALYSTNPIVAVVVYLASSVVFGWQALLQSAVRGGVLALIWLLYKLAHKTISKGSLLLYCFTANIFYLVYNFDSYFVLFDKIVFTACAIAFAYVCVYVFRALFVRGLAYQTAFDERLCLALFSIVVVYRISQISVLGMEVIYFIVPFALLFCHFVFGEKSALICASVFGLGNLLATGLYDTFAYCVACSIAVLVCGKANRYLASVGIVVVDVLMSYLLHLHGSLDTIVFVPTIVSVFVFVVIPTSVYKYLQDVCGGNGNSFVGQSVMQKLNYGISRRLYRLSDIFLSMKNTLFVMSTNGLTSEQAQNGIVLECSDKVCKNCDQRTRCWRQELSLTEQSLLQLARCAVERGRCSILDVPQTLSVKCSRITAIISQINSQAQLYKNYCEHTQQVQTNRQLLGDQMGGISNLLLQLASDCKNRATFDHAKEQELQERLVFHNVMCVSCAIAFLCNALTVTLTVAKKDVDKQVIEKVCSTLLKQTMVVDKLEQTESAGWVNVILSVKPRFEVTFGVASMPKKGNDVSGDTHSVINTDNGKCIVALCDGMGSGNRAEQMSSTAIGLIENFYRAGFDNDVILSCVNKVLTSCNNDCFCAVDVVVLDLFNGLADFVKLGATVGLVKNNGVVEIVKGSSLPLGVLDEMKPSITKMALNSGDVVVLMSDGIVDNFSDISVVATALSEVSCVTAQTMAQTILDKALKQCHNVPQDDMTVLVAKVI